MDAVLARELARRRSGIDLLENRDDLASVKRLFSRRVSLLGSTPGNHNSRRPGLGLTRQIRHIAAREINHLKRCSVVMRYALSFNKSQTARAPQAIATISAQKIVRFARQIA